MPLTDADTPMSMSDNRPSPLSFPCHFPIKVIGKNCEHFNALVFSLVSPHAPDLSEDAVVSRPSGQGNYLAVTITIQAVSREQLDTIYRQLTACDQVIMAL